MGKVIDQIREIHRKAVFFGFCSKEAHFEMKENHDDHGKPIIKPFSKKRVFDEMNHPHDKEHPQQKKRVDTDISCNGCERVGHKRSDCRLKDHPDFNKEGDWKASKAFKTIQLKSLKDAKGNKIICYPSSKHWMEKC